jgi:hypothetical protein
MGRSQAVMTLLAVLFLVVFGVWLYRESNPGSASGASGARTASDGRVASGVRTPTPKPTPPPPPAPIALTFTQQDASAPLHLIVMLGFAPGDVHAVDIGWNPGTLGDWHYNVITGGARLANFDDHHMVWGAGGSWIDLLVPPAAGKKPADIGFVAWDEAAPNNKFFPTADNAAHPSQLAGVTTIDGPSTAKAGSTVTYHVFTTAAGVRLAWSGFGGADLKPSGSGSNPLVVSASGDVSFKVQSGTGSVSLFAYVSGTNLCCPSNTVVLTVTK